MKNTYENIFSRFSYTVFQKIDFMAYGLYRDHLPALELTTAYFTWFLSWSFEELDNCGWIWSTDSTHLIFSNFLEVSNSPHKVSSEFWKKNRIRYWNIKIYDLITNSQACGWSLWIGDRFFSSFFYFNLAPDIGINFFRNFFNVKFFINVGLFLIISYR